MDRIMEILKKYQTYIGVKDVKLVIKAYKTRDAFTDLTNRIIYLNKYLIDDEEVVEYLIIRELLHIKLHMYPPMRYGTTDLTYIDKFYHNLHFFVPKEKVEDIKAKIMKKLIEVNRRLA